MRTTRTMPCSALLVWAVLQPLVAVEVFTGGINNRKGTEDPKGVKTSGLTLPEAKGWPTVAAQADGFYLHPVGWFHGPANMGIDATAARRQLLDNFHSKHYIVEDSYGGQWKNYEKGKLGTGGLRFINDPAFNLSVNSLRPEYMCVGYNINVSWQDMASIDPDELVRRFKLVTKPVRDAGIPIYWCWTPTDGSPTAMAIRDLIPGTGMERWEYLAVKSLATGVGFDIPPGWIMTNGGSVKRAMDSYMHDLIPRCRTRKLKSLWLCNVIHCAPDLYAAALDRVIKNDAVPDIIVPTNFGDFDYPATPETAAATTTGATLHTLRVLKPGTGTPGPKPATP